MNVSDYIAERTHDFVGREWLFLKIKQWMSDPAGSPYFIIIGEPGIGKTAIAARLTQLYDLAATHFCIARQAETVDPFHFASSLSHQLMRIPGFAESILEQQGAKVQTGIDVDTNYGKIVGVHIENLPFAAPSATTVFNRVVLDPLMRLFMEGFNEQLVILVDALDEAVNHRGTETIVDLLANSRGLFPQVRFILTSRPDSVALRNFDEPQMHGFALDAGQEKHLQDVHQYVYQQIEDSELSEALQVRLAEQGMHPSVFVERMIAASQGNFLYLALLLPAIANGSQRLDDGATLPEGLGGIYRDFLRNRKVGQDLDLWRSRYRPVVGVLTVAQASLTIEQLQRFTRQSLQQVDDALLDISQFLDQRDAEHGRFRLYRESVADFLTNKDLAKEFWIDSRVYRELIVTSYCSKATNCEDVDWSRVDEYGLLHLAEHLHALRSSEEWRNRLYALVESPSWTAVKYLNTPWVDSLTHDLQLASNAGKGGSLEDWVRSIGYELRRALIDRLMSVTSARAVRLLVSLGQVERAIHFARRAWDRFGLLQQIARAIYADQPEKALAVLLEMAHITDGADPLKSCKTRLASAQDIMRLLPQFSGSAEALVEEARGLLPAVGEQELLEYRVEWELPTLALMGELGDSIAALQGLPTLWQARGRRHISVALDESRPEKHNLAQSALDMVQSMEETPEVVVERLRALIALIPLVDETAREGLLEDLASAGDYLQSVREPAQYNWVQTWAIQRVAQVDLDWAKHMLLESEWTGALGAWSVVIPELARENPGEAIALVTGRFSNHFGSSDVLADVIGIVARKDVNEAEALIDQYETELKDDLRNAYLALAEGYVAAGNRQKAAQLRDEYAFSLDSEGLIHARGDVQLAILRHAAPFLSVKAARDHLMHFPVCPHCSEANEQKAIEILARMAGRQDLLDLLEELRLTRDAKLVVASDLADFVDAEAARRYLAENHMPEGARDTEAVYAHILAKEAYEDPTRLDTLLQHFYRNQGPHHFCAYMTAVPDILCRLVKEGKIEAQSAIEIIERIYALICDWHCTKSETAKPHRILGTRCECYDKRDGVLSHLVGVMAMQDLDRAREMIQELPKSPLKVYALVQILRHTQFDDLQIQQIIDQSQVSIQDPSLRASLYYELAGLVAASSEEWTRRLIALAEPLLSEEPKYERGELGIRTRVGPSRTKLKTLNAQALLTLIRPNRLHLIEEAMSVIETLTRLSDKLEVLDVLVGRAVEWPEKDKRSLLWHNWGVATNSDLTDVQALLVSSIPLVHSLDGVDAFWHLYRYIAWAYEGLERVS